MKGIGIDIESVKRFENLERKKNKLFFKKIYSNTELDYCFKSKNIPLELAKFFCLKEAIYKSLMSINVTNLFINDIKLYHLSDGSLVASTNKNINNLNIQISFSSCKSKCIAFAYSVIQ